jgi:KDO2-lipid IV(A) lauroyltransferase
MPFNLAPEKQSTHADNATMKKDLWRLINDKNWRKQQSRYWLEDPFWGGLDIISHYALRYLPLSINAKTGAFLGPLAAKYRFTAENDRARHNLSVLRPDLTDAAKDALLIKMWQHIGQSMSEYSILDKIYAQGKVTLENTHFLQPLLTNKQAVIFVSVHTGNWEVFGNCAIAAGLEPMALYKPVRNRFARKIANAARDRMCGGAIKLVDANEPHAMRLVCQHLANKGVLWLAIDEYKNGQVHGPRFGRPVQTQQSNAAYAVRLAQRYHAVIVPVWTLRHENAHFSVTLGCPLTVAHSEGAIQDTLVTLDKLLEAWVLEHIEQWYMLHDLRLYS